MANFTPQEIEEILQQFFDVTGKRQYIGARYVPIFGRKNESSITWDNSAPYEPLTIVLYQGNSYTSRTYVPAGVLIDDTRYWALTGNYNAQVEEYRRATALAQETANGVRADFDAFLPSADFSATETVKDYVDDATESLTAQDRIRALVFDTVADMKASDKLYVGAVCHTLGFYDVGDGGGAWYKISGAGTANEMNVISCTSLFAVLCAGNEGINVLQLGCPINDDNTTCDSWLQYAVDNYSDVLLPISNGEKYFVTGPIRITNDRTIVKSNTAKSIVGTEAGIHAVGTTARTVLEVAAKGCVFDGIRIFNIDSVGIGRNVTGISYTLSDNNADILIKGCKFEYLLQCVTSSGGRGIHIEDCVFSLCSRGVYVGWTNVTDPDVDESQGNVYGGRAIRITNNRVTTMTDYFVQLQCPATGTEITNNVMDGGIARFLYIRTTNINSVLVANNVIMSTPSENGCIESSSAMNNLTITDNIFSARTEGSMAYAIKSAGNMVGCIIANNKFLHNIVNPIFAAGELRQDVIQGNFFNDLPYGCISTTRLSGTSITNNVVNTSNGAEGADKPFIEITGSSSFNLSIVMCNIIATTSALIRNVTTETINVAYSIIADNKYSTAQFMDGLFNTLTTSKVEA